MNKPLLSIAIPTYNRSVFLKQSLESICSQLPVEDKSVEIIVSDNCSTDNTSGIVDYYIKGGQNIKYIKNDTNLGPDKNIAQCFLNSTGAFVLVLGDDDFFIDGALQKLLSVIKKESNAGIIYIKGLSYDSDFKVDNLSAKASNSYYVYYDKQRFIEKVNYNLTFISGNILNKALFEDDSSLAKCERTNLIQLAWTIPILLKADCNIVIEDDLLGIGSVENTGGYKLFEVFAVNFNRIMHSFSNIGLKQNYIDIINRELITSFFPYFLIKAKKIKNDKLSGDKPGGILYNTFRNYALFWIALFPVIYLPSRICRLGLVGSKLYGKYVAIKAGFTISKDTNNGHVQKKNIF